MHGFSAWDTQDGALKTLPPDGRAVASFLVAGGRHQVCAQEGPEAGHYIVWGNPEILHSTSQVVWSNPIDKEE